MEYTLAFYHAQYQEQRPLLDQIVLQCRQIEKRCIKERKELNEIHQEYLERYAYAASLHIQKKRAIVIPKPFQVCSEPELPMSLEITTEETMKSQVVELMAEIHNWRIGYLVYCQNYETKLAKTWKAIRKSMDILPVIPVKSSAVPKIFEVPKKKEKAPYTHGSCGYKKKQVDPKTMVSQIPEDMKTQTSSLSQMDKRRMTQNSLASDRSVAKYVQKFQDVDRYNRKCAAKISNLLQDDRVFLADTPVNMKKLAKKAMEEEARLAKIEEEYDRNRLNSDVYDFEDLD